jgi:hypothetical protein
LDDDERAGEENVAITTEDGCIYTLKQINDSLAKLNMRLVLALDADSHEFVDAYFSRLSTRILTSSSTPTSRQR